MSDEHMMSIVKKYTIHRAYFILESYGYIYVGGDAESKPKTLLMCDLSSFKFVKVVENNFFGCKPQFIRVSQIIEEEFLLPDFKRFCGVHKDEIEPFLGD